MTHVPGALEDLGSAMSQPPSSTLNFIRYDDMEGTIKLAHDGGDLPPAMEGRCMPMHDNVHINTPSSSRFIATVVINPKLALKSDDSIRPRRLLASLPEDGMDARQYGLRPCIANFGLDR